MADVIGWTVDEPEMAMVPATGAPPVPAVRRGAGAGGGAAVLAPAERSPLPLLGQAPTTKNAARASAERRFGLVIVTRSILLQLARSTGRRPRWAVHPVLSTTSGSGRGVNAPFSVR